MQINGQEIFDPLARLQQDVMNLLKGNPALGWTPIYKFKDLVIADVANQNIDIWKDVSGQNKIGTAIEVRMPALRPKYANVPGAQKQIEMTVRVFEDPAQNTTGLTCESLALEVERWLDGQIILSAGAEDMSFYPDPSGYSPKPVYDFPDRFTYDVVMVSEWPRDARARCPRPLISDDGAGNVTLDDTSGTAQVYVTLDGSTPVIPAPGQPGLAPCFIYQAPFAVANGAVVTWLAWQPGMLPSFVGRGPINNNGVASPPQ